MQKLTFKKNSFHNCQALCYCEFHDPKKDHVMLSPYVPGSHQQLQQSLAIESPHFYNVPNRKYLLKPKSNLYELYSIQDPQLTTTSMQANVELAYHHILMLL